MKTRFAKITFVCFVAITLSITAISSCGSFESTSNLSTESVVMKSSMENGSNNANENTEVYSDYTAYSDRVFQNALINNPIDKDFEEEYEEKNNGTSIDIISLYKRFSKIWKNEMKQSAKWLSGILDDSEKKRFRSIQEKFNNTLTENMDFVYDNIFSSGNQKFHITWLKKYMESYRERTFEIKWISYCLEWEKSEKNMKVAEEFDSLKFYYPN